MMKENTIKIFSRSFKENWDLPAVTDYNTKSTLTYGEFAQLIAKIHLFYNEIGIKRGDHIALIGKNTPSWVATFMATITYGAVIVPILQEFNPNDAQHIINHSDSVLLMSSKAVFDSIDFDMLHKVRAAISLDDVSLLAQKEGETVGEALAKVDDLFKAAYPDGFTPAHVKYPEIDNKELMVINYTSGTTGFSKGVMITGNNLAGNIVYGIDSQLCFRGSKVVSFLPLAHAYGCAFDMLCQLAVGAHITLLGRIPSPKIIVKAMNEIHPNLVITVPLVLEKIYTKLIVPKISKGMLRWALAVPLLDNRIYDQIRKQLVDAFGGNFEEVIVGGAPFNAEVEEFLYKIRFPFTVGYGMTECAPLVSHTPWREFVLHSAGRVLPGIMEAKILSDDPENTPGEICVKGENVMMGYYHNYEATDKVLDDDGKPVSDGVGRVVSTDLWNLATPFVRYDTQDLVEVRGGRIQRIMGRECETLIVAGGQRYMVHNFVGFFQEDDRPTKRSVTAYQVVKRKSGAITFRLVVNEQYNAEIERYIVDFWHERLQAPIDVELVDEIPLMKNNKRLTIIDE